MFKTQNLYQNDPKWKGTKLGNSNETIGGWGCLLTSTTMMLNGIGYSETPDSVNDKMKNAGGFQGAFFIPSVLPYVWPNCAFRDVVPCESWPAPLDQIDAAVAAGKPVILQVDWNKQAGIQTHFVLVKERKGDDYVLYDPYMYPGDGPDKEVLLTKRYKYNGATLDKEISAVIWFESYSSAPPEPPKVTKVPVPSNPYTIYAIEDDLAFRATPDRTGYLWKRLLKGTQLTSLESKDAVKPKLGAQSQWVNVQDPAGDQGFVAAWYVSDSKDTPSPDSTPAPAAPTTASTSTITSTLSAPATTPAPAAVKLPPGALAFFPTEEVSFRTGPAISSDNLIRRVPATEMLICVEPANQAIPKVGVTNQWLQVKDASGKQGYVAAWYVKYASGAPQPTTSGAPASAPAPAPGGVLKVTATAEGIALRKQPVVSDATLIYRLPLGTIFTVTEPNAEGKVGKNDQWLKVKDPNGADGYIAAWFVSR